MAILVSWIGNTDLRAAEGAVDLGMGPIVNALTSESYEAVHLLSDYDKNRTRSYVRWLATQVNVPATSHLFALSSPTNLEEIYRAADSVLSEVPTKVLTLHLSPGTPAMAAIWILLAKTRYPARLIESSRGRGTKEVRIPFDLSAEFLPGADKQADDALTRLMQGLPPEAPAFSSIVHRCDSMKRAVAMAHRLALRDVSVLLQGESGTGKELFARAIHQASARSGKPFVAVNCGAIPQELIDAELFGHEKGAFTGAATARAGYFESADGGTLFLDEVGELPLPSQVRLLRVLQEREVTRIGGTKPRALDLRIIAATNRVLPEDIRRGRFREDLYHRLAVGVLVLPPLREREGDINLLVDSMLQQINADAARQPGYKHKKLDSGARNLLLRQAWPGNIRELHNALVRASIWAAGDRIASQDVAEALAVNAPATTNTILGRSLEGSVSLPDIMAEVARHYLQRGVVQAQGNKSEAARLLGLGSYQTLSNWLEKYGVK